MTCLQINSTKNAKKDHGSSAEKAFMEQTSTCIYDENKTDKQTTAWFAGSKMIMDDIKPTFRNLKEEVLKNKFCPISKRCWNDQLTKCVDIYKCKVQSLKMKQWIGKLKENNIGIKELIALKLYCDYDNLQREYRKCFRFPYNEDKQRLSSFYWWNKQLSTAFKKFNQIKFKKTYNFLFHGISSVMNIDRFKGKYFGPLSTTTDISVARSFAGQFGMILVIEPNFNEQHDEYKPFDISYLSDFPDEHEVLCFDQSYCIKDVILSSELDTNIKIYKMYGCNANNAEIYEIAHKLSLSESSESSESIIEID